MSSNEKESELIMREAADQSPDDKDAEEIARVFGFSGFKDRDHLNRKIAVQKLGTFEELITRQNNNSEESKFSGAKKIIDCFAGVRNEIEVSKDKTISKRPHLLIAGGFVRDTLLNKKPHDIDFATDMEYENIIELFKKSFTDEIKEGKVTMGETGKAFGVLRLKFSDTGEEYEVANFRIDGDYSDGRRPDSVTPARIAGVDADRRDLTINSLFYNPFSGNIIDYTGGLDDLKEKRLKFVGEPEKRISEDRLRMLRYIRFLVRTGFFEDGPAKEAILKHAKELNMLPAERIRIELNAIFLSGKTGDAVEKLKEYGLLREILPEVESLSDCGQGPPYHMEGSVYQHTVMTANALPENADTSLRWAAILHDISKPETKEEKLDKDGKTKVSFIGHAEPGAEAAGKILNRLKFSNEEMSEITWLIENHIRAFSFPEIREAKARKMAASPYFLNLFELAKADTRSSVSSGDTARIENENLLEAIEKRYLGIKKFEQEQEGPLALIKKAVNGHVIIEKYKKIHGEVPQGKNIGLIKEEVYETIDNQKITDVGEALKVLGEVVERTK
ncbi:MAG: CCA tRNA nucleotidyltransferase [bacterium]|nr:CCA tRNA nucleotidyltransferase [bacterium]